MRAVGFTEFGDPDVLRVVDKDVREAGPGEIRIRVTAAAVNPTDLLSRAGAMAKAYERFDAPWVVGMDAAGIVESVGEGVDRLVPGDVVMAVVSPVRPEGGAQAESIVVPAASAVPIPEGAHRQAAAVLPMNGLTAIEALDLLDLPSGATLLVTGGAGHLASFAIALAKERGLRVLADAKDEERDLVASYGADEVLARGDGLADRVLAVVPDGVHGVLDTALLHEALYPAIRDGGGLAVVRGFRDDEAPRGIVVHRVFVSNRIEDTEALLHLRELAGDGRLRLVVAGDVIAEDAADAHRRMAAGGVRGRLVLTF